MINCFQTRFYYMCMLMRTCNISLSFVSNGDTSKLKRMGIVLNKAKLNNHLMKNDDQYAVSNTGEVDK